MGKTPQREYKKDISKEKALKFIILIGFVSLFADMTYEGSRSITGPYLSILGASAAVVGFAAGFGELVGYALRLLSGYITERTGKYWTIIISGYFINLLAVPLLALAGNWKIAIFLIKSFGIHEFLDQMGAVLGSLIVASVLYFKSSYQISFAILLIPAILALSLLISARWLYPNPHDFEKIQVKLESKGLPKVFWVYLIGVALIGAGYADFALIAYHFKKISLASDNWIPIFYAIALGSSAFSALFFGRLFDKAGFSILIIIPLISLFFAPFVFLGNFYFALLGIILWGIGMGAQLSVIKAAIAEMVPANKRPSAYGIFNAGYGIFWFLGSALMGFLYDISLSALIIFSVLIQLFSIPLFILVRKNLSLK
ncbi:MAG: MFS transporter [Armatimonadetes bacterium]|nr:MFS transporter [Armatimonadota bacterium]